MGTAALDKAIENIVEMSAMGAGAVQGTAAPLGDVAQVREFNKQQQEDSKLEEEALTEEDEAVEEQLRKYIRNKIAKVMSEHKRKASSEENALRRVIRRLIKEGDVSDMHPHRSTGINTLEDLLKKVVPTLRTDYKRLTTDKLQRDSFRAHMLKAIKDSLLPSIVNAQPGADSSSMLLQTPGEDAVQSQDQEIEDIETAGEPVEDDLAMLDEVDVEIEDDMSPPDKEKMIPVEDDDVPSDEEAFGIEGEDETGRNMAFATNKKIQQYILDAFDSLGNPDDRKIFIDYLITNIKLYFDKFEDELQTMVDEPTTPEYEQAAQAQGGI
jgi:hypothetical protein